MFNPAAYENSRPDGMGVLEIVADPPSGERRPCQFVPLKRTELRGEILGPLASLRLVQTYGYSREQCDRVVEAVYRFPLPGDAAVTGVHVRFGDVEIRAELKERGEAQADYEEARRRGSQAALVTRESPDVFTLQVAGVQPEQEVTIETCYVQLARTEASGWSLRVPLTTAPRYLRSDEVTAPHAHGQPLLLLRDPGHRFSLDVLLPGAGAVMSPTHRLDVTDESSGARVRLRDGEVIPDRDCVLTWRPRHEQEHPMLQALLHDDAASEQVYFLALAAPPAGRDAGQALPREVVLLVDHSGSMEGAKWEAADWAVKRFLSGLTASDAFTLGLFHNTTRWFSRKPRHADAGAVEEAIRFLEEHRDSGGTELGVALEQALDAARAEGERARSVLIVTDAQVTDAGRILRLASEEAQRADRRRISVLCIDAAPNSFLALELAERGGGTARFLTSDPEEEDIATALDEVLAEWSAPVLTGLQLEVNRPDVQAAGRAALPCDEPGWSAIDLGDLPAARPVWVAGRAPRGASADLRFQLADGGSREVASCQLDLTRERSKRPAMKALFGARRILGLEFLIHSGYAGEELRDQLARLGYDPDTALAGGPEGRRKIYGENVREDAAAALRELLVRESLEYGVASAETAFVAVRLESGQPVEGTVAVANALPAGWSDVFVGSIVTGYGASPLRLQAMTVADAALSEPMVTLTMGMAQRMGPPAAPKASPSAEAVVFFSGIPRFMDGEALLFDSSREQNADKLPDGAMLTRLEIRFPGGTPKPETLDPGLSVLLFVEDLTAPRARVELAEIVRQGGQRPLNVRKRAGHVVRIILQDAGGAWAAGAPQVELALAWVPRGA